MKLQLDYNPKNIPIDAKNSLALKGKDVIQIQLEGSPVGGLVSFVKGAPTHTVIQLIADFVNTNYPELLIINSTYKQ